MRVRVACAQPPAAELASPERALREALDAVAEAKRMVADILVLPECSYPAYVMGGGPQTSHRPDDQVERIFGEAARCSGVAVLVGLAQGVEGSDMGRQPATYGALLQADRQKVGVGERS